MNIRHDLLTLLPELILAVGAMAALLIGAVRGDKATKFLSGLIVAMMAVAAYFVLTAPDASRGSGSGGSPRSSGCAFFRSIRFRLRTSTIPLRKRPALPPPRD